MKWSCLKNRFTNQEAFVILLEVHAAAEEKHFYPHLMQVGTGEGFACDDREGGIW